MASIKETATRIIRKMVKNGYEPVPGRKVTGASVNLQTTTASYVTFIIDGPEGKPVSFLVGLNDVIFDHDAAKALWGDGFKDHLRWLVMQSSVKGRIAYIGSTLRAAKK